MRRTEAHQGVRMIKFSSILSCYEAAEFSQAEAAELLGIGERTFRRWRQRFEDEGEAGLLDRRLGKASGKRVPSDWSEEVEALYRTRYAGFTAKHFHEHLVKEHNFSWGYTWTKTFLYSKGLLEKAKRRGAHRRKRERRPLPGMSAFASPRRSCRNGRDERRASMRSCRCCGAGFYNGVLIPTGLLLLAAMAAAPLLRWGAPPETKQREGTLVCSRRWRDGGRSGMVWRPAAPPGDGRCWLGGHDGDYAGRIVGVGCPPACLDNIVASPCC